MFLFKKLFHARHEALLENVSWEREHVIGTGLFSALRLNDLELTTNISLRRLAGKVLHQTLWIQGSVWYLADGQSMQPHAAPGFFFQSYHLRGQGSIEMTDSAVITVQQYPAPGRYFMLSCKSCNCASLTSLNLFLSYLLKQLSVCCNIQSSTTDMHTS